MATATVPVRSAPGIRPKYVLFGLVGLMIAYVMVHNESFLIHPQDPVWHHYHPFRWWLLPHGLAGVCAIFLGPLQFSDRLRQRYTKLHRVAHWCLHRWAPISNISTSAQAGHGHSPLQQAWMLRF